MSEPVTQDGTVYARYVAALRGGDRHGAFAIVDRASDEGMLMGDVYMDVLQPALREIGRLWQQNEISVADEHLATAITQATMARVFERSFQWSDEPGPSILAACGDTERHEVGLRMLCDMLEARGWSTYYLGAAVPADALVQMVKSRQPTVVALSVALTPHVPRLRAIIDALRDALGDAAPLIIAGGRPLRDDPSLATLVGADLTAPDAAEAVRLLEERVRQP